jgi:hypothetical protein
MKTKKMKTTGLFCLFLVIFSYHAGLSFAETNSKYLPVNGVEIQPIAMEKIPEQIATMQQNIAAMSVLLMQMSSALQKQNLTVDQQKKCGDYIGKIATSLMSCTNDMNSVGVAKQKMEIDLLEKEWNYWESEDFESH